MNNPAPPTGNELVEPVTVLVTIRLVRISGSHYDDGEISDEQGFALFEFLFSRRRAGIFRVGHGLRSPSLLPRL